jgi:hypothetical protein
MLFAVKVKKLNLREWIPSAVSLSLVVTVLSCRLRELEELGLLEQINDPKDDEWPVEGTRALEVVLGLNAADVGGVYRPRAVTIFGVATWARAPTREWIAAHWSSVHAIQECPWNLGGPQPIGVGANGGTQHAHISRADVEAIRDGQIELCPCSRQVFWFDWGINDRKTADGPSFVRP